MIRACFISLLLSLLLLPLSLAYASCYLADNISGELPGYIHFGNIIVQRDTPVGAVLATATTGTYNADDRIAGCQEPWNYSWQVMPWKTISVLGNSIYDTNIPGVGMRLTNTASGKVIPYAEDRGVVDVVITGDGIKAELIKTGNIVGGVLIPGVQARASANHQLYFANVTLSGSNSVTAVACQVITSNVNVPLGEHDKSEFNGIGSTTNWQSFNIGLDCDRSARVNVRIDPSAGIVEGTTDVMKLDNGDGESTAGSIGIQLGFRPNGSSVMHLGQETFYATWLQGGSQNIELQARYYQTEQNITPGLANGTATFTLTYK